MRPLAIIPTYMRDARDYKLLRACLRSIASTTTAGEVEVLIVDDGSPDPSGLGELGVGVIYKEENSGFSQTVNIGLRKALEQGRDAILVNADVEFVTPGWPTAMRLQHGLLHTDRPAAVIGALLLYPHGLIQHGGIYFSLLTRTFDHLFKYGPAELPEALEPACRPVTGALQFIRHECLQTVGLYDEAFRMGWEDVDYCIRVFNSDRECVYQPEVRAFHHESVFRGRPTERIAQWQQESWMRLMTKISSQNLAGLVPTI